MRRELGACSVVLVLTIGLIGADNDAYADSQIEHCGNGEITALAQAGHQGSIQLAAGIPASGLADANIRCQARLYDDNGPSVPHVWCEDDSFLLGIWSFANYKFFGVDRMTAAAFYELTVQQIFWTSPWGTTEVEVSRTTTKDAVDPRYGHLLTLHDYVVFGQEPIQPGFYSWEWISRHPFFVEPGNPEGIVGTGAGEVEIVPHQEHLSRVAAGTW